MKKKTICWTLALTVYAILLVLCYNAVYYAVTCESFGFSAAFQLDEERYLENQAQYIRLSDEQAEIVLDLIARNEMFNISRTQNNDLSDIYTHVMLSYDKLAQEKGHSLERFREMEQAAPMDISLVSRSLLCMMMGLRTYYHPESNFLFKGSLLNSKGDGVYDIKGFALVYEMFDGHVRSRELFLYDMPEEAHFLRPPDWDEDDEEVLDD